MNMKSLSARKAILVRDFVKSTQLQLGNRLNTLSSETAVYASQSVLPSQDNCRRVHSYCSFFGWLSDLRNNFNNGH